jgi:hypothetical protein
VLSVQGKIAARWLDNRELTLACFSGPGYFRASSLALAEPVAPGMCELIPLSSTRNQAKEKNVTEN